VSNNKIVVSICCVTYNHESFIKNCLDGFVSQKTDFNYEILIHDDASTDKTQSIIKSYEDRYPDLIHGIYQSENQWIQNGRNPLLKIIFPMVRGKYIALCEGDDYWTDTNKLQKQAEFLENNDEYSMIFHRINQIIDNTISPLEYHKTWDHEKDFSSNDLALGNFIPSLSVMYRNFKHIPEFFAKVPIVDYAIHLFNSQLGKIKYMPDYMANYRIHDAGVFSKIGRENQIVNLLKTIDMILLENWSKNIKKNLEIQKKNLQLEIAAIRKKESISSLLMKKLRLKW